MLILGGAEMDWRDRLESISANLQGGARAAEGVGRDITTINGTAIQFADVGVMASLARHARDAEECAVHQRGAMRELRQNLARLGREVGAFRHGP